MKTWFGGVFVSFLGLNEKRDVFLNYFKIKKKNEIYVFYNKFLLLYKNHKYI